MQILSWKIDPALEKEVVDNYRTSHAIKIKDREPMEIIREMTFDGVAPDITLHDIEKLFDFVEAKFLRKNIEGIGLEVGAGPLPFSSILAKRPSVEKVYGVEICRPIVEVLAPKVSEFVLGKENEKIVGVVGSFDELELPASSVDFIFDFFSLHHSNDLRVTLKECNRILKPGGFIFCFDKARPDSYTQKNLDELMDHEYGPEDKAHFGYTADQKFTRRMNGEREYRLKDWKDAFLKAGYSKIDHFYLNKTSGGDSRSRLVKTALSMMPVSIQLHLNRYFPEKKHSHKFLLDEKNRVYSRLINSFPKEISLIIAYK